MELWKIVGVVIVLAVIVFFARFIAHGLQMLAEDAPGEVEPRKPMGARPDPSFDIRAESTIYKGELVTVRHDQATGTVVARALRPPPLRVRVDDTHQCSRCGLVMRTVGEAPACPCGGEFLPC